MACFVQSHGANSGFTESTPLGGPCTRICHSFPGLDRGGQILEDIAWAVLSARGKKRHQPSAIDKKLQEHFLYKVR